MIVGKKSVLMSGITTVIRNSEKIRIVEELNDDDNDLEQCIREVNPDVIVFQVSDNDFMFSRIDTIKKSINKNKVLAVLCGYNEKTICRFFENGIKSLISAGSDESELISAITQISKKQNYISDVYSKVIVYDLFNMLQDQSYVSTNILTPQETRILNLICEGLSNKEIGYRLDISKRTVETHRRNIKSKLEAKNTVDLVKKAALYM